MGSPDRVFIDRGETSARTYWDQTEAEEEPSAEDLDLIEAYPVDEHNPFLADRFAGSAEKRMADTEFLASRGCRCHRPDDDAA